MKATSIYVALALLFVVVLGQFNWWRYYQLTQHGVEARGVILRSDCANHQTFQYEVQIAGRRVVDIGQQGIDKQCADLVPGDPVIVFYLPDQTTIRVTGYPKDHLRGETLFVLLSSLSLPALIVYAYRRRRDHHA